MCPAIFATISLLYLATIGMGDILCTIADTQHRQPADKLTEVNLEGLRVVDRERRATEDDSDDGGIILRKLVVRKNLAEGVELSDTTSDELRGLRSEIENDNLLLHILMIRFDFL